MTENVYNSFDENFCVYLEFHLTAAFELCEDEILRSFWCDGVAAKPWYKEEDNLNYVGYDAIQKNRKIVTDAWLGSSGQERYEMTIFLGEMALAKHKAGEDLIACVPDLDNTEWIYIDPDNRVIEITLL
ncbi:hypothetical protein QNI19_38380 [Cytophagaceae bacterium DM2B3-1]|uniref:Lactoylglutathione lyase n=1 Tax=Xanthocytophaga flava TaxID=3048013 RepID=A0ABT7CYJ7_9BACT|nr:hypothetical protein [Xanthocytophaga flavus]MDJ1473804.1 hypothetical protein [Xanthocytophaga flavus]MDJ1498858.1 hypothetical protein [Xanthocytophaga flavus]